MGSQMAQGVRGGEAFVLQRFDGKGCPHFKDGSSAEVDVADDVLRYLQVMTSRRSCVLKSRNVLYPPGLTKGCWQEGAWQAALHRWVQDRQYYTHTMFDVICLRAAQVYRRKEMAVPDEKTRESDWKAWVAQEQITERWTRD